MKQMGIIYNCYIFEALQDRHIKRGNIMLDKKYKIPSSLTPFQETFYKHLIDWKWKHVTTDPGLFQEREYDALLPDSHQDQQIPVYKPIIEELRKHDFKPHKQYGKHMASSQAACINLFTPFTQKPGYSE